MKILKFGATWCTPCKQLSQLIEATGVSDQIESIDVDTDPKKAQAFRVRSVPTMIKLDADGNEVSRKSGAFTKTSLLEFVTA